MPAVVLASGVAGLVAAAALVALPAVPPTESATTGSVLCGFAIGWAALVAFSTRFTDQPQRWAAVPAAILGAGGVALLTLGSSAHPAVDWAWPPVLFALAVWMAGRIRRHLSSRVARWLLYPAVAGLGLAAIGGAYQSVASAVDAASVAMPGRLVDVGGHRMHLTCTGSGSPTVVVEAGGGEMAANLGWVTADVSKGTTVCAYDRAGRGWSEATPSPQDAVAISTDLHTLLHRAGVAGPYVMAGHSFGGLYVLSFASQYPDEVAGMVLIDSTSPKYDEAATSARSAAPRSHDVMDRAAALASSLSRLGVGRLFATLFPADLPPVERDQVRASTAMPATLRSTIEEYLWADDSMREAASLRGLGDKPLVVLSAGVGSAADWPRKQQRLAALSSNSIRRVVSGASHEDLVGDPVHALTTSRAVLEVVTSVRTGRPVSR